jgi:periplasmic divalent cation tolerance protein
MKMAEHANDLVVILSTAAPENAHEIARAVVGQHLAACVNCTGVRSYYRWKGELCDDEERLMIIKTVRGNVDALIAAIRAVHTYELPEIIVLPIIGGHEPYLSWVREETST